MDKMLEVAFDGPVHRSSVNRDLAAAAAAGQRTGRETGSTHYRMLCYGWPGSCYKTQQETTDDDDDDDGGASSPSNLLPGLPKEESRISLWIVSSHITKKLQFFSRPLLAGRPCLLHLSLYSTSQSHLISSRVSSLVDAHSSAATVLQAQPPPSASLK